MVWYNHVLYIQRENFKRENFCGSVESEHGFINLSQNVEIITVLDLTTLGILCAHFILSLFIFNMGELGPRAHSTSFNRLIFM